MARIHVGVVRGGTDEQHSLSLATGRSVLEHLSDEKYLSQDIVVGKDGVWLKGGVPVSHERILRQLDVVFNALHGSFGEDGSMQHLLQSFGVPYTGSPVFASMLGMNKHLARTYFVHEGLAMPLVSVIRENEDARERARELFNSFPIPAMIKPATSGSSLGASIARDCASLVSGVENARAYSPTVVVEEYITGTDASVIAVNNFRGEDTYVFPPVEVVLSPQSSFYDTYAKYGGEALFHCPARFSKDVKHTLMDSARKAHRTIGARHYSRADFIVNPRRGVYLLEVNTLPDITPESLLAHSLEAVGSGIPEFLDHVLMLALQGK